MEKYLISAALTVFTECLIAGIQSKNKDWVIYVMLVNLVTNPAVNLLYNGLKPLCTGEMRTALVIVLETAVLISETWLFYSYRKRERKGLRRYGLWACGIYALVLNLASYFTGVLVGKMV